MLFASEEDSAHMSPLTFIKDAFILVFGFVGFIFGTYASIVQIIQQFERDATMGTFFTKKNATDLLWPGRRLIPVTFRGKGEWILENVDPEASSWMGDSSVGTEQLKELAPLRQLTIHNKIFRPRESGLQSLFYSGGEQELCRGKKKAWEIYFHVTCSFHLLIN